jgi:hypothetical protein
MNSDAFTHFRHYVLLLGLGKLSLGSNRTFAQFMGGVKNDGFSRWRDAATVRRAAAQPVTNYGLIFRN